MKNIVIPNPTYYKITYADADGKVTTRTIVPISQDDKKITAYCYHSHGVRSFLKESITAITSTSAPASKI